MKWFKPPIMPEASYKACILKLIVTEPFPDESKEGYPKKIDRNGVAFWIKDEWRRPMDNSKLPDAYKVTHWTYLDDIEDPEDY